MRLSFGIKRRRVFFRLLPIAFVGLATALGAGSASATAFEPSWTATLANTSPGAASSMTLRLDIPAPDANFGQLLNFIPADFAVTSGDDVPDGAIAGTVNANATLGLVNGPCNTSVSPVFEMVDASIDPDSSIPIYAGVYDYNGNGLADNVDYYPSFLSIYAPQLEPVARYYSQTVVAGVIVPLNFVIFEPGAPIPLYPALDPALGYPVVVIIGDPIEPIQPIPISDFCSPLETATTLRGVSGDNPATAADEGGATLRRNPSEAGAFNSVLFARSGWDGDGDGIENQLDPCPYAPDASWDPRSAGTSGDADGDGLPDSCDPNDGEPNSDEDGDGYLNRQDPCPRLAEFSPFDSDRDGVGDSCDAAPNDASDSGANHRHDVCLADTMIVGSPASSEPAPFNCPGGPDLPVPPTFSLYPEESVELIGTVHSIQAYLTRPQNAGPAVGVEVHFEVLGANPTTGSCLTGNFGYCQFNYLGANAGTDVISASATVDGIAVRRESTNEWVGPPANDDFAAATTVTEIPFEDEIALVGSDREEDEPSDCLAFGATVWYRFTPSETAFVTIEIKSQQTPLALAAYTGPSLADLAFVACDTGIFGPVFADSLPPGGEYYFENYITFPAEAGVTYQVQVGTPDSFLLPEKVKFSIDYAQAGDGNCSGDLTALDALEVLRKSAGLPAAECASNGDMDCDGGIDAIDALLILRVVAGVTEAPEACLRAQAR